MSRPSGLTSEGGLEQRALICPSKPTTAGGLGLRQALQHLVSWSEGDRHANSELPTLNASVTPSSLLKFKLSRTDCALSTDEPVVKLLQCPLAAPLLCVRPREGEHCFVPANGCPVPRTLLAAQLPKVLVIGGVLSDSPLQSSVSQRWNADRPRGGRRV